jgi:hypothetical protein
MKEITNRTRKRRADLHFALMELLSELGVNSGPSTAFMAGGGIDMFLSWRAARKLLLALEELKESREPF